MWLPHGTAADVSTEALKAQMYLCKYDDPYKWKTPCKQVSTGFPAVAGLVLQVVWRIPQSSFGLFSMYEKSYFLHHRVVNSGRHVSLVF
jgi:hypothetical protein